MNEIDLKDVFSEFGDVNSVKIIKDQFTGRSKGYGFVKMNNEEDRSNAINDLNGKEIMGRTIKVSMAHKDKE